MSAVNRTRRDGPTDGFGLFSLAEPGAVGLWLLLAVTVILVFPPLVYLIKTSLTVEPPGAAAYYGLKNFVTVTGASEFDLWRVTLLYAIGSSLFALFFGSTTAWLVARTNVPFRGVAAMAAYLSLAVPVIIKGIGWILLLGPNRGLINIWLKSLFGLEKGPIDLYTLGGMIFVEGLLWTPIVFLLTLPPMLAMDPAMEEAAAASGARFWQRLRFITLPLARPSILAVLLLTFIRSLESFEVPLLIGIPGNLHTFTTVIFSTIHTGFFPRYGEAAAYAALLILVVSVPLVLYYRLTKETGRFATVTGKGYRPQRIDLGRWRLPCTLWILVIPLSLIAPVLILLWASFLPIYTPPSLDDFARMSLAPYASVWQRPETVRGLWNSFMVATTSATLVAMLTLVLAWVVIRRREAVRWALDFTASLPLVFPGIVLGIAVLVMFLELRFIPIYGTIWILVFAFVIRFLPYGMRYCYSGIISIHQELEESARTSGAPTLRVLWAIVLPLTMPAVVAAWLYVFLITIRDLSVAILLSGPQSQVVSIVILDLWNNGEVSELGALSVLLAIIVTLIGLVFERMSRRYQDKV